MADLKNKLTNSESMKYISNIRTPMTPDNKYRRIGLLIVGITLTFRLFPSLRMEPLFKV